MISTLFLAICVLGCDVLIYFLFQWTLGEKGRTKRRRVGVKKRIAGGQETALMVVPVRKDSGRKLAKILPYRKSEAAKQSWRDHYSESSNPMSEEAAHRRRAAAFAGSN